MFIDHLVLQNISKRMFDGAYVFIISLLKKILYNKIHFNAADDQSDATDQTKRRRRPKGVPFT